MASNRRLAHVAFCVLIFGSAAPSWAGDLLGRHQHSCECAHPHYFWKHHQGPVGHNHTCKTPCGTECSCPPHGPFFGYFPTCWSRFPSGWQNCPVQDWEVSQGVPLHVGQEVHAAQEVIETEMPAAPMPTPAEASEPYSASPSDSAEPDLAPEPPLPTPSRRAKRAQPSPALPNPATRDESSAIPTRAPRKAERPVVRQVRPSTMPVRIQRAGSSDIAQSLSSGFDLPSPPLPSTRPLPVQEPVDDPTPAAPVVDRQPVTISDVPGQMNFGSKDIPNLREGSTSEEPELAQPARAPKLALQPAIPTAVTREKTRPLIAHQSAPAVVPPKVVNYRRVRKSEPARVAKPSKMIQSVELVGAAPQLSSKLADPREVAPRTSAAFSRDAKDTQSLVNSKASASRSSSEGLREAPVVWTPRVTPDRTQAPLPAVGLAVSKSSQLPKGPRFYPNPLRDAYVIEEVSETLAQNPGGVTQAPLEVVARQDAHVASGRANPLR